MPLDSPLVLPALLIGYLGAWFVFWYFRRRGQAPVEPAPAHEPVVVGDPAAHPRRVGRIAANLARPEATLVIGVLLPWLLLVADPTVFRGSSLSPGGAYLGPFRAFAYSATLVFTSCLLTWLLKPIAPAFFTGVLFAGTVFALGIAVLLLPVALFGILLLGLGLLGLLPFLVAYVYSGQAQRAWAAASAAGPRASILVAALLGCLLPILVPGTVHVLVERRFHDAIEDTMSADAERHRQGLDSLRSLQPIVDLYRLGEIYQGESDQERRKRIGNAFETLTGESIMVAAMD